MSLKTEKRKIRGEMRRVVAEMSPSAREAAGNFIAERVWTVPEIAAARVILLYSAMPDEVPTAAIAAEARSRRIVVTYPRCIPATREMAIHRVQHPDQLRPGEYGILEPTEINCPLADINDIDAAIVPGVAWDKNGGRLGRGAGYYDRLFAHPDWRAFRCGIFFARQEVTAIPMEDWDSPLDAVITENEVFS
ncbi:MAG TPA: 5-formyltetrahydrofolate cyclo-ligase [Longimicrobiaceae bacterium]|nr:5-formyltetrahydrofolate cyclo-ligase [Longimicrobiaceae bacterium]